MAEKLLLYVDGTLSAAELAAVRDHLEECGPCGRDVDLFQQMLPTIQSALSGLKEHPTPEDLCLLAAEPEQLGGPERQRLELHLQACLDCSQEFALLSELERDLSDGLEGAPIPQALPIRLRREVQRCYPPTRPEPAGFFGWLDRALAALTRGPVLATVTTLLVVCLGFSWFHQTPNPSAGETAMLPSRPTSQKAPPGIADAVEGEASFAGQPTENGDLRPSSYPVVEANFEGRATPLQFARRISDLTPRARDTRIYRDRDKLHVYVVYPGAVLNLKLDLPEQPGTIRHSFSADDKVPAMLYFGTDLPQYILPSGPAVPMPAGAVERQEKARSGTVQCKNAPARASYAQSTVELTIRDLTFPSGRISTAAPLRTESSAFPP